MRARPTTSDTIDAVLAQPVVVRVLDREGQPSFGTLVTFQAFNATLGVGGTLDLGVASSTTDSRGDAAASVRLGTTVGGASVAVRVPGLGLTDTVPMTVRPGAVASVGLSTSAATLRIGEVVQVSAEARDRRGNRAEPSPTLSVQSGPIVLEPGGGVRATGLGKAVVGAAAGTVQERLTLTVVPTGPVTVEIMSAPGSPDTIEATPSVPVVARISDSQGTRVPDATVVLSGDNVTFWANGRFAPSASLSTGQGGEASVLIRYGPSTGEARLVATAVDYSAADTVTATVRHGAPAALKVVAGAEQVGREGTTLPEPLRVRVVDRHLHPVVRATVLWSVVSGGGGVDPVETPTGTDGVGQVVWTLGRGSGQSQEVRATLGHLAPASFRAVVEEVLLFSEDFEQDLRQWTGRSGGTHHAELVADPRNPSNRAVRFTRPVAAGDIFSVGIPVDPHATYVLSFDYLGLEQPGSVPGNLGGFIGFSDARPGVHTWLAGTYLDGLNDIELIDDGTWHSYRIPFVPASRFIPPDGVIHLMLEDFEGAGGVGRDAYFDNVTLRKGS